jgi:hypothetical protein
MSNKSKKPPGQRLPGGIARAKYMWPRISCIHPEHGVYESGWPPSFTPTPVWGW